MSLWRRFEIFNTDYYNSGMYLESWNFSVPLQDILGPLLAILGSFLWSVKYSNTATSHLSKIHTQRKIQDPFRCLQNMTQNWSPYEFRRVSRWILLYIYYFLMISSIETKLWTHGPWTRLFPTFDSSAHSVRVMKPKNVNENIRWRGWIYCFIKRAQTYIYSAEHH